MGGPLRIFILQRPNLHRCPVDYFSLDVYKKNLVCDGAHEARRKNESLNEFLRHLISEIEWKLDTGLHLFTSVE